MLRAVSHLHAGRFDQIPIAQVVLTHDERHIRRKLIELGAGRELMVDLPLAVALENGDMLVLEDGRLVEILAADEELMRIGAGPNLSLAQLCWHIGNRHLPAQINADHILILPDHVIRQMLEQLGASVSDINAAFSPMRGAYHADASGHHHG